jgi:hypothetical protein
LDTGSLARTVWVASVSGFFLLALVAGRTPRYGSPFNTILELLSLPIVLVAASFVLDQPLTGTVKAALAFLFLGWFALTTYRVWRRHDTGIDSLLAQAASISALLLMAHSLVDYPLRTTALACFFAFACAMSISATVNRRREDSDATLRNFSPSPKFNESFGGPIIHQSQNPHSSALMGCG